MKDWTPTYPAATYVEWAREMHRKAMLYPAESTGRQLNSGTCRVFMDAARAAKRLGIGHTSAAIERAAA